MPAFLLLQALFQRFHELFPAAHGLDLGFFFRTQVELGLLAQPLEWDVGFHAHDGLDALEVLAEGAVEFVEVGLVLD